MSDSMSNMPIYTCTLFTQSTVKHVIMYFFKSNLSTFQGVTILFLTIYMYNYIYLKSNADK